MTEKTAVLTNFLEIRRYNVATKGDITKKLQVALSTAFLSIFTILASCKSVSMTSFLVTKTLIACTKLVEIRVQSE